MKAKLGRPKVPKTKLRGILIQARVSQEENKVISAALKRSKDGKSEWVRKALLSAASQEQEAA